MDKRFTAKTVLSVVAAPAVGIMLVAAALVGLMALMPGQARAADPPKTGYVVVRFGAQDAVVRPFTFTQPISSYRALQLAGLNPVSANTAFGLLLCGIGRVGKANSAGDDCDNGTYFWSTSYWGGGAWQPYGVGVGDTVISQNGHVDGFAWVDWSLPPPSPEPPPAPQMVAASKGLEWLRPLQDAVTGGYGTPNDTIETLLAVVANQYPADEWRRGPNSPSLAAAGMAAARTSDRADGAGKLAVAMAASGGCEPLSARDIMSYYDAATGQFSPNAGYQAWAMMGLRALSQTIPAKATQALLGMQKLDGGWAYGAWSIRSDTNGTALAIQALIAAGEAAGSTAVQDGLDYLKGTQNTTDGGFSYDPTVDPKSDANSTAYVVQAILAAGEDPMAGAWKAGGHSPIDYLLAMQLSSGAFEWQSGGGANQSATRQAVPALLGRSFPWASAFVARCEGVFLPLASKQ